jgi:hypothetical protein
LEYEPRNARLLVIMIPVPVPVIAVVIAAAVSHEVRHADFISAAKALAIRLTLIAPNMRMTVLVSVVHVRSAVVVKIPACAFDAILKTLALGFAPFLRWRIPAAAILRIAIMMFLGQGGSFDRA